MDKKFGKYSEEQWETMLAAMREEKFGGEFITEELEPLIKEFFVCETKKRDGGLELSFLNGQKFLLKASEIK